MNFLSRTTSRLLRWEPFRFVLAGGLNTVVTYVLYLLLLSAVPYRIAYTTTFAIGIVLGYTLNTRFVFREPWSWRRLLAYPAVYAIQYILGIVLLTVLVSRNWVSERIAPLVIVVLSLPIVYAASRLVIRKGRT